MAAGVEAFLASLLGQIVSSGGEYSVASDDEISKRRLIAWSNTASSIDKCLPLFRRRFHQERRI